MVFLIYPYHIILNPNLTNRKKFNQHISLAMCPFCASESFRRPRTPVPLRNCGGCGRHICWDLCFHLRH